jgi:hypothetical protein
MNKNSTTVVAGLLVAVLLAGAGVSARQGATAIKAADGDVLGTTQEVLKKVSQLRELEPKGPVKSGLKTKDEIEQAVIKDLDESTTPAEFEGTQKTMVRFGLIPRDFLLREYIVRLLREQVAGFYEPKTREFYLAAWVPLTEQKTVMAHELMHALQDQHFNLRRFEDWPKGDSDAELAIHALVEGEATIVMYQYAFDQQGVRLDVTKIGSLTERMLADGGAEDSSKYPVLAAAPAVLRESLQFPYVYGAGFVQQVLKSGSWPTLNSAYNRLPSSTEQIIHPEKFINRDEAIKIDMSELSGTLGGAWKRVDADVNGEFGYQLILREFVDKSTANKAASGWGGDRYLLYENKNNQNLLVQYTTWDSLHDAREFFEAYSARIEKRYKVSRPPESSQTRLYATNEGLVSISLRERDVVIVEGALDRAQLAKLENRLWSSKKSPRT